MSDRWAVAVAIVAVVGALLAWGVPVPLDGWRAAFGAVLVQLTQLAEMAELRMVPRSPVAAPLRLRPGFDAFHPIIWMIQ